MKSDSENYRNDVEKVQSSKRDENSLFCLTKKFIQLISASRDQIINMTQASLLLQVAKRRIYDITNVLEGLGMISKWSVNSVKWIGGNAEEILISDNGISTDHQLNRLFREEMDLDENIKKIKKEIDLATNEKNLENAYITYEDLQNLKIFKNKLVFAVKTPSDTTMEYPRYQKGAYRLKINAEKGQISVFYVNNENDKSTNVL